MVSINYSAREVCCKIVYYGPGLSGKTTNLQYVHSKVPQKTRGKLISLATEADRTLYFDFLPLNIGTINGLTAKFQLYTVPGQVYYNATRKLVLRGVDGLVFVADSQPDKMDENIESLTNLVENLVEYGYDPNTLPIVIQYNKQDLPGVWTTEQLNAALNKYGWPSFEASATVGNGVFDTLKSIIKMVLDKAKQTSAPKIATATPRVTPTPDTAASSEPPTPPQPPAPTVQPEVAVTAPEVAFNQAPPAEGTHPPAEPGYRPYPGSDTSKTAIVSQTPEVSEMTAGSEGAENTTPPTSTLTMPQMAPSVRKKETKKRGFFKRLFGLK